MVKLRLMSPYDSEGLKMLMCGCSQIAKAHKTVPGGSLYPSHKKRSGWVLIPSPDQKKTFEENAHTKNTQPWGITDNQVLTDSGRAGCGHKDRTRLTTVRDICLPLLTLIPFPRDNVGMDASVKPESQKMPLLDSVLGYP